MNFNKSVFISYRRSAASYIARAIRDNLRSHGFDVFLDVESLGVGPFPLSILEHIESRAYFIVILTPDSVKRCQEEGDWLRREIEHALNTERKIVPVVVDDFDFKSAERYLTGYLSKLQQHNALTLSHAHFEDAMKRLLHDFLGQPRKKTRSSAREKVKSKATSARSTFDQASVTPENIAADVFVASASKKSAEGDYVGAIADYTEALRIAPQYVEVYHWRGIARAESGDFHGAISDYTEAISLRPDNAEAYINRGVVHGQLNALELAIRDFNEAIKLNPENFLVYTNRAYTYLQQYHYDAAIADYTHAIQLQPTWADLYQSRGIVQLKKRDFDGAIATFDQAIYINPNIASIYYYRGYAYYYKGEYQNSVHDLNEAIRLSPQYDSVSEVAQLTTSRKITPDSPLQKVSLGTRSAAYYKRGEAYAALKKYKASQLDFKQAYELYQEYIQAITIAASVFNKMGQLGNAQRLWKKLSERDTDYGNIGWLSTDLGLSPSPTKAPRKIIQGMRRSSWE